MQASGQSFIHNAVCLFSMRVGYTGIVMGGGAGGMRGCGLPPIEYSKVLFRVEVIAFRVWLYLYRCIIKSSTTYCIYSTCAEQRVDDGCRNGPVWHRECRTAIQAGSAVLCRRKGASVSGADGEHSPGVPLLSQRLRKTTCPTKHWDYLYHRWDPILWCSYL